MVTTDPDTDFWRQTHYGFVRDSGHLFGVRVAGEFTATVVVSGGFADQYDQAGLMVRLDAERWVKGGLEYVDGRATVAAVVTHVVSDWSSTPLPSAPDRLGLRVSRRGDALRVEYRLDHGADGAWTTHRLGYLPPGLPVSVGPMAASPTGAGFDVVFHDFTLQD